MSVGKKNLNFISGVYKLGRNNILQTRISIKIRPTEV